MQIPYPFNWQELKDLFRGVVNFIGYVAEPIFPYGKANGYSWIRAGSSQDARLILEHAKNLVVRGCYLRVHVFEIGIQPTEAKLLDCNCTRDEDGPIHAPYPEALGYNLVNSHIVAVYMPEEVVIRCLPDGACGINMGSSTIGIRVSTGNPSSVLHGSVFRPVGTESSRHYSTTVTRPSQTPTEPSEVFTAQRNTQEEPRTVRVNNVKASVSKRDLEFHLRKFGNLERCDLFRRNGTGSTGVALVLAIYETAQEADYAAMEIPKKKFSNNRLTAERVRPVDNPLIANGSGSCIPLGR